MFKTNTYFDDKVMSIAFKNEEGIATVGVMAPGTYSFATTSVEYMTVVSGIMEVQLPGATEWKTFKAYETFIVEGNTTFDVKVASNTCYKCIYK
ncbi:pyrimidine/purine nucleoside phosphorylase [Flavobacteriaceae bacterium KMM 6897]|nr:pyrimidine/purine nucleoside phosphorylase [Flavobacteriaceae bacterium KMM 6897]